MCYLNIPKNSLSSSVRTFLKVRICQISTLCPSLFISEWMLSLMILIVIVAFAFIPQ